MAEHDTDVDSEQLADSWSTAWADLNRVAVDSKDSQAAVLVLAKRYRRLSGEERPLVDKLLAEALVSGEEWKRFDALVLISDFRVRSARPKLDELAIRLEMSLAPGAQFELRKVRQIIAKVS